MREEESTSADSRDEASCQRRWRHMRRWAGLLVMGGIAASAVVLWRQSVQRADQFLDEANRRGVTAEVAIESSRPAHLEANAPPGVNFISTYAPQDAALLDGRPWVAATGGLLAHMDGRSPPVRYTHLSGLAGSDLTAAGRLSGGILLGDRAGGLTLVDGERAIVWRAAWPRACAIVDILSIDDTAYILAGGLGVFAFDGRRLVDLGAAGGVDLSAAAALCHGPGGLRAGGRDGQLWLQDGGRWQTWSNAVEGEPVTALACPTADPAQLVVGTPFGLYRVNDGQAAPLARDLFVTSLAATPAGLYAATFDQGLWLLDPQSGARRTQMLAGHRLDRLRLLDGRLYAFGPSGTYVLEQGQLRSLPPASAGLTAAHVTALAREGAGPLWVGTFAGGIDILDDDLRIIRHLPQHVPGEASIDARDDQINALLYRGETHEMLASTVRGLDIYSAAGLRRLPLDDEETGGERPAGTAEGVAAAAWLESGLALATSRGVTLVDGARARTLYAFHGLANNHVYAVATWGKLLVAGTLAGVSLVEPGRQPRLVRNLGTGEGLPAAWITALTVAPEGVYLGTYGGGVALLHPDLRIETMPGPRLHVNPGAMTIDRGRLWVGTLEAGLLVYDRAQRSWSRLTGSLAMVDVTAIWIDRDDFYVGSSVGLLKAPRMVVEANLAPTKNSTAAPRRANPSQEGSP